MRFRVAASSVFGSSLRFSNLLYSQRCHPFRTQQLCSLHNDGRTRLSAFWAPTGGIARSTTEKEDSNALLIRGGFIRQAHSGLFHFLPLGLRVQEKLERLLDKHMTSIGASKVSLSTLSSEELWQKSGRLSSSSSELFRLHDRKDAGFLLSPTHEEEITSLVGSIVKSYKDLPLRLYQITRKYRDEPRPRQGLFRTREFLMKDLYTFDTTEEEALKTYATVQRAYAAFFREFGIPYHMTNATSGEMGGHLSHEVHMPSEKGEDSIVLCDSCKYATNEELAQQGLKMAPNSAPVSYELPPTTSSTHIIASHSDPGNGNAVPVELNGTNARSAPMYRSWTGLNRDQLVLVQAFYPTYVTKADGDGKGMTWEAHPDLNVIQSLFQGLDLGIENPMQLWKQSLSIPGGNWLKSPKVVCIFDKRLPPDLIKDIYTTFVSTFQAMDPPSSLLAGIPIHSMTSDPSNLPLDFVKIRIQTGDKCPQCAAGSLRVLKSVELGHTFHLGVRYSKPLGATVASDPSVSTPAPTDLEGSADGAPGRTALQMGCHGIGVSRLLAALASAFASPHGLNWPRLVAPFEAVVIPSKGYERDGEIVYDTLTQEYVGRDRVVPIDVILDDRAEKDLPWKMKDADLIGYPVVVVLGRGWKVGGRVEVQCRRLGVREEVDVGEVRRCVEGLLGRI